MLHPGSGEATLANSNPPSWQQFERNQVQPALLDVTVVVLTCDQARDDVAAQESVVGNTFHQPRSAYSCITAPFPLSRKIRTPDRGLTKVLI